MVAGSRHSGGQSEREESSALGQANGAPYHLSARQFFTPLLHVALFSYLLATPVLALTISIDIDFGGRWMCDPRPVGTMGVVHDRDGVPICQFEVLAVTLFWTFYAAIVSPVPIFGVYVRRHLTRVRQLASTADSVAQEQTWRRFYLNIGVCVLFAAVMGGGWLLVGGGWPLSFLVLPGAALAMYVYRCWREVQQKEISP